MNFLGLDYSTQKLKALIVDNDGNIIYETNVDFDSQLSHYHTFHGVHNFENGVVYSPPLMWIEATDMLLNHLSLHCDLSKVVALSGSAQQHTTMFWASNINNILSCLDYNKTLLDQLKNCFSQSFSPSWMDSSTQEECYILENSFGGKLDFQYRIGSTLAKRFSGPQIMKAFKNDNNLNNSTDFITLVSNGICSVFAGKIVGMDAADAAGTGLTKSGSKFWDDEICSTISGNLTSKLGVITSSNHIVGYLSDYFVRRYKMNPMCQVVSFTGDNPSSVIGMMLKENDICISLGTSDTLFVCLPQYPLNIIDIPIFVFPHPLNPEISVTLLCYKNGSQTRENVSSRISKGDWDVFSKILQMNPPGNNGVFVVTGLYFDLEEIIPPGVKGRFFIDINSNDDNILNESDLDSAYIIRSLIEGQLLTKLYHFSKVFPVFKESTGKLLITGGGSINEDILQIASDIFQKPVYTIDTVNSASLGAVYRAIAATHKNLFYSHFANSYQHLKHRCNPISGEPGVCEENSLYSNEISTISSSNIQKKRGRPKKTDVTNNEKENRIKIPKVKIEKSNQICNSKVIRDLSSSEVKLKLPDLESSNLLEITSVNKDNFVTPKKRGRPKKFNSLNSDLTTIDQVIDEILLKINNEDCNNFDQLICASDSTSIENNCEHTYDINVSNGRDISAEIINPETNEMYSTKNQSTIIKSTSFQSLNNDEIS